jgi:hypothetical protein
MMKEHEETIPLAEVKTADNGAIKSYFKSIFPEFDEERVYVSDMKKMLKWYDLLKANDLLNFEEKPVDENENTEDGPEENIEAPVDSAAGNTEVAETTINKDKEDDATNEDAQA